MARTWPVAGSIGDERRPRGRSAGSGRTPATAASACGLQAQVDRGVDAEAAGEEQVAPLLRRRAEAVVVEDPLLDLLDEVRRRVALLGTGTSGASVSGSAVGGVVGRLRRCRSCSSIGVEHDGRAGRRRPRGRS